MLNLAYISRVLGLLSMATSHPMDGSSDDTLRLDETLPGTSQTVAYRSHSIKLHKPFDTDFDET